MPTTPAPKRWSACLQTLEAKLTKAAFESLSKVPALERNTLLQTEEPLLRLIEPAPSEETSSPDEEAVIDSLRSQINELAQKLGVPLVV